MKKNRFPVMTVALAAAALLGITVWRAALENGAQEEKKTSLRIGVLLYRGDDTFIGTLRSSMEQDAKEYEQETGIRVTLDVRDAKRNQMTQNSQAERMIGLNCDVLCVNMVDRSAASGVIDKAMEADIPIVFFNREPVSEDMNRWDQLYYVGADAKESAVLEGQIVTDQYKKDPASIDRNGDGVVRYVLLEGESSHQDSLIRTEWSIQTLKDAGVPIEKVIGGIANWERSQASALMEQWLEQYPGEIELVVSNNDDMALGAIDAIDRAGVYGITVVGIDATTAGLDAVHAGKMLGTVSSDKKEYAGAIMKIATAKALGEEIPENMELENGKYYWSKQRIFTEK